MLDYVSHAPVRARSTWRDAGAAPDWRGAPQRRRGGALMMEQKLSSEHIHNLTILIIIDDFDHNLTIAARIM